MRDLEVGMGEERESMDQLEETLLPSLSPSARVAYARYVERVPGVKGGEPVFVGTRTLYVRSRARSRAAPRLPS